MISLLKFSELNTTSQFTVLEKKKKKKEKYLTPSKTFHLIIFGVNYKKGNMNYKRPAKH